VSNNLKTVFNLLHLAADILIRDINRRNGNHYEVMQAVVLATQEGRYRKEVLQRAEKWVYLLASATTGRTSGRLVNYGKTYSASLNEHAVNNVIRNAYTRAEALRAAARLSKEIGSLRGLKVKIHTSPEK